MSGYKPGYSEEHSPTFLLGVEHATRDAEIAANCPAGTPIGPASIGAMYRRGYFSVPIVPHVCTRECSRGAA